MPEGHSVHRIAKQFQNSFTGSPLRVTSPQGRFSHGANQLDGHQIVRAYAVGKQLFVKFDHELYLRVHLGIYGAWDFSGAIATDAALAPTRGEGGQTRHSGRVADAYEDSPWSIGAPRRTRIRMAENEKTAPTPLSWPPEVIGQVRVRLLSPTACADLRGPTSCVVATAEDVAQVRAKLGPDPLVDDPATGQDRFVRAVLRSASPIALLLMNQSIVAGIGNVYRAELLFRAHLDPFQAGNTLPEETVRALWQDWTHLLNIGVSTGQMLTMDNLNPEDYRAALANRSDRHWVYRRAGEPCRVCGTNIAITEIGARKLYWCPVDQK